MAIAIKQKGDEWIIEMREEAFLFKNLAEAKKTLLILLDIKNKGVMHGKLGEIND